jgi:zinc and cadmium transporter
MISLIGVASLGARRERIQRLARPLVAFAAGALLGDAFFHLVPEAFSDLPSTPIGPSSLVLGGMLSFFLVERLLRHAPAPSEAGRSHLAVINLVGDAIHNFVDGAMIAASFLVSPSLGASTALAVALHEIPQELGDFGVLVHSGLSVRGALLLNLGSAVIAVAGAAITLLAGTAFGAGVSEMLVPFTAGGFVYIALADLVPELQADRGTRATLIQSVLIGGGCATMAALTYMG